MSPETNISRRCQNLRPPTNARNGDGFGILAISGVGIQKLKRLVVCLPILTSTSAYVADKDDMLHYVEQVSGVLMEKNGNL